LWDQLPGGRNKQIAVGEDWINVEFGCYAIVKKKQGFGSWVGGVD